MCLRQVKKYKKKTFSPFFLKKNYVFLLLFFCFFVRLARFVFIELGVFCVLRLFGGLGALTRVTPGPVPLLVKYISFKS
jgi:hypothetical protein